jgi:hypothetical protein
VAELIEEDGFAPHFTTPRTIANEDSMGQMKTDIRLGSADSML